MFHLMYCCFVHIGGQYCYHALNAHAAIVVHDQQSKLRCVSLMWPDYCYHVLKSVAAIVAHDQQTNLHSIFVLFMMMAGFYTWTQRMQPASISLYRGMRKGISTFHLHTSLTLGQISMTPLPSDAFHPGVIVCCGDATRMPLTPLSCCSTPAYHSSKSLITGECTCILPTQPMHALPVYAQKCRILICLPYFAFTTSCACMGL